MNRGNPLRKRGEPKQVHLTTVRVSTLNWHMIERSNPLLKQRKCARWLPNTFLSWKHKIQHWTRNTSWSIGTTRCKPWRFKSWANNAERSEHGLPNSGVATFCREACSRVRELVEKIEDHPDRHVLHKDLQQNQAYNPFSPEWKRMSQDLGNVDFLNCLWRTLKRSAKHAYHTGVKASSIAHAGIS